MDPAPISAVIVDDHVAIRDGVTSWFESAVPPIEIVDASDRVGAAWQEPGAGADVVILDLQLAAHRIQEFAELRRLAEVGRQVVVYTQDVSRRTAVRCIEAGALAFVTKSEGKEHLVAAVQAAADGRSYTPPALSGSILEDEDPGRPRLSTMELAALRAWFSSSSKTLAATMLGISPKTLDGYIGRVRIKYAAVGRQAPTKTALVHRALEDGLVTMSDLEIPDPAAALDVDPRHSPRS